MSLAPRDRWAAAHCAAARELFARCGARGADVDDDELAIVLTSLAGQFAFHATLLYDLLPVRADVDRDALVEGASHAAVLAALDDLSTVPLCAVLARVVVPRLRAAVLFELEGVDPRVDGPRARALTLVARDLVDARDELERCTERLMARDDALEAAAAACAKVEHEVLATRVVIGLVD